MSLKVVSFNPSPTLSTRSPSSSSPSATSWAYLRHERHREGDEYDILVSHTHHDTVKLIITQSYSSRHIRHDPHLLTTCRSCVCSLLLLSSASAFCWSPNSSRVMVGADREGRKTEDIRSSRLCVRGQGKWCVRERERREGSEGDVLSLG